MDQTEMMGALSSYLRQVGEGPAQVVRLDKIGTGWETEVYVVAYAEAAGWEARELVLRIYPGSDGVPKSGIEFRAMRQLYEMGYAVPRVLFLEQSGAVLGRPFMLMEKITGQLLGRTFDKASPERQRELLGLFCGLFVQLHTLDYRPFLRDAADVADPRQYTRCRQEEMAGLVRSFTHEFDPVLGWLRDRAALVRWDRLSVIHMDYHGGNILLRDDDAPFVIDWGGVDVADYRFDLAWTLLLSSGYGKPEARAMILAEYERLAGHPVEDLWFFDVWAAMRRLFSIVVSVQSGADKLGMRPGAEQAMLRNTTHIRMLYRLVSDGTGLRLPSIESWLATLT